MADDDLAKLRIDKAQFTQRRAKKSRLLVLLPALAILLGAGVLYAKGMLTPAVEVRVASVATLYPAQTFTLLNASGYVVAQRKAALGSKVTSRLVFLGVEEGNKVKEGQVIARLENEDVSAARNRAKANIGVASATLDQAEAELEDAAASFKRNQELLARKMVARSEFDTAEARYKRTLAAVATSKATLQASRAALAEADVQLDYTLIKAPFDAVVLTKNADIGDIITPLGAAANARASVITIADLNSIQAEVDVSESNIDQVKVGQPCEIQLDALPDTRFRGKVHMIVPTADRSKASVMVKIAFVDKDPRILPEMSAKVAFLQREIAPEERQPVTAIPATAVREQDGKSVVYAARGEQAVATPVQLGRRFADFAEVTTGLQVGDRIVVEPGDNIKDGAKLRLIE
jgi:RND family efflux transporter MFP subunit